MTTTRPTPDRDTRSRLDPTRVQLPEFLRTGRRPIVLAALAFAAVAAAVLARLYLNLAEPGASSGAGGDYRDTIFYPVRALLDGINPYDPEAFLAYDSAIGQWFPAYGPLHLALYMPFALLPFEVGLWLYAAVTVALTVLLAWWALGLAGFARSPAVVLVAAALLLASNPGRANLVALQSTVVIVLGCYLALSNRDRPWAAAAGVALACLKPQFGLPLLVLLPLIGRGGVAWRGGILALVVSVPVTIRLTAIEGGLGGVIDAVLDNLRFAPDEAVSNYRVNLTSSFDLSSTMLAVLVAAGILLVAAAVLKGSLPSSPAGLTVATTAILLGLFHLNYDLLLLTWPVLAAAYAVLAGSRTRLDWALLGLLLLLFFNPVTSSFVINLVPFSDVLGTLTAITLVAAFVLAIRLLRKEPLPVSTD